MSAARRGGLGVLGGAFNPPHVAHLLLAQEARWQLGLERVLLVTTGEAPHKEIEDDPGAEVRLEMTRRAAEGEAGVEASAIEVERIAGFLREQHVPEMGRVEGAAEDAERARRLTPAAARCRGRRTWSR